MTSTLFLGCALLAVRAGALRGALDWRALSVVVFYVAASAAATAVKFQWHPLVLGMRVSLRGIAFALLVLTAVAVLKTNGRPLKVSRALVAAAAIAAGAVEWPSADSVVRAAAGIGYLAIKHSGGLIDLAASLQGWLSSPLNTA